MIVWRIPIRMKRLCFMPDPLPVRHTNVGDHNFLGARHDRNARKTLFVLLLCAAMMVVEIAGGIVFRSIALLADGLHMATHAGAMLVAAFAYRYARERVADPRFSFGTGKVGDLAAFGSAIVLASTSVFIVVESVERLLAPQPIAFTQAIPIACVGLVVNLASLWLLRDEHEHEHHGGHRDDHEHAHEHAHGHSHHHHEDHNLRAAYVHVLSDAAVSVLAIAGLIGARQLGWLWLDPIMGLVGAFVILRWSAALIRSTSAVLLDRLPDGRLAAELRDRIEADGAVLTDFHLWRLGPGHHGIIASLTGIDGVAAGGIRARLLAVPSISHVTIEVGLPHG